jgi:hypothetical protein
VITAIATLDSVLDAHAVELGCDFAAYRNHTYRLVNLCVALSPHGVEQLEKIAIAAAFHDLGIWTDHTFDYLGPSVRLAAAHLARAGQGAWIPEVTAMILEHHKLSPYRPDRPWLVEPFRRADWVDVSKGLFRFGLPRAFVSEIQSVWPSAGFHTRLVRLELARLRTHPWSPLPMMRL